MQAFIVHYNTPKLTAAAVRSLWKHTPGVSVTVLDNSNRLPIAGHSAWSQLTASPLVTVVGNTHGEQIDFDRWLQTFPDREPSPGNNYGSAKHCYSVQWFLDRTAEPFLLMDSDVLIRRDVTPFFQHTDCAWVGELGENVRRRFGYDIPKLQPFLCWLNTPLLKAHGIDYFNGEWMWNLTTLRPNHRYDTGAWLHRAVSEARLPTCEIPLRDYIHHLGHASWKDKRPMDWLNEHRGLWA